LKIATAQKKLVDCPALVEPKYTDQRFGESMDVQYFFLCDPECPPMPPGAQLPLVLVNGDVLTSGGKISVPVIRCKIEDILKKEIA